MAQCYSETLGEPGGEHAHKLLHTHYSSRKRIEAGSLALTAPGDDDKRLPVRVCVGTSCFVRGSQTLLKALMERISERQLAGAVDVQATFCFEQCNRGPTVQIGERVMERCTWETASQVLDEELSKMQEVASETVG